MAASPPEEHRLKKNKTKYTAAEVLFFFQEPPSCCKSSSCKGCQGLLRHLQAFVLPDQAHNSTRNTQLETLWHTLYINTDSQHR